MKKYSILKLLAFLPSLFLAQELQINNHKINLSEFVKSNEYSLQNLGVDQTLEAYISYRMVQDFTARKKIDTTKFYNYSIGQKENEIKTERFYPEIVINPVLDLYLKSQKAEYKIQTFFVQKTKEDKTDYDAIYHDVLEGKMSIENAIKKHTKASDKGIYIKSGSIDLVLDEQIRKMPVGGITQLINNKNFACFVKLLDIRPSLGHVIFGTISYPNDAKAAEMKQNIQKMLAEGNKFEMVSQKYGSDENETKNGGVVMGSPTLPDEVYAQVKNLKAGQQTQPILIDNKWFIFNVYSIRPHESKGELRGFYINEMNTTNYIQYLDDRLVDYLRQLPEYKESDVFAKLKNSYSFYKTYKNDNQVLYNFGVNKLTFKNFKDELIKSFKSVESLDAKQWSILLDAKNKSDLLKYYELTFLELPENKSILDLRKKEIIADFFYNYYVKDEFENNPKVREEYFQKNQNKYKLPKRAKARIIIPVDNYKLEELQKAIVEKDKWNETKEKYGKEIDSKNQLRVNFEEGEMQTDADVFLKYNLKFQEGVQTIKIGSKTLIIAIDELLPERTMTLDEAMSTLKDDFAEQKIQSIIENERKTSVIKGLKEFSDELLKTFKK